jgi:hypothetical protein
MRKAEFAVVTLTPLAQSPVGFTIIEWATHRQRGLSSRARTNACPFLAWFNDNDQNRPCRSMPAGMFDITHQAV